MSYAGGRKELPYGLNAGQLLAISNAHQQLKHDAEAQKHTAPEHAARARHAADELGFWFPEILRHYQHLIDRAARELEREERQRETEP